MFKNALKRRPAMPYSPALTAEFVGPENKPRVVVIRENLARPDFRQTLADYFRPEPQ